MTKQEIKFGQKAKDRISGFTGVVTGRIEYITGTVSYLITAPSLEGKEGVEVWFNEKLIEIDPTAEAISL